MPTTGAAISFSMPPSTWTWPYFMPILLSRISNQGVKQSGNSGFCSFFSMFSTEIEGLQPRGTREV